MIFLATTTKNDIYMNHVFSTVEDTVDLHIDQTKSQLFFGTGAEHKSEIATILHMPKKNSSV